MMLFSGFIHKYNSKNKATSKIKIHEVLKKIGLESKVRSCLRDGIFSRTYGILNLHPSKRTHWIVIVKIVILIHMAVHHSDKFLVTKK